MDTSALLLTEHDCRPLNKPCAAVGSDAGIVLGPGADGRLVLESTSQTARIKSLKILSRSGGERAELLKFEKLERARWQIELPPGRRGELRVWMSSPGVSAVFPIL